MRIQVIGPGLPPLGWLGFGLFTISIIRVLIGNYRLYNELLRVGVGFPRYLRSMAMFVYPLYRPARDSRRADRLALGSYFWLALFAATVMFLGKYMWRSGA